MKQETGSASLKDAQETFNQLITGQTAPLTFEQAFDMLATSPDAALSELAVEYFSFDKPGQVVNFVVEGHGSFEKDGKIVEVVNLRDREGKQYINGDKVLVSATKRLNQLPAFVKVTYVKDQKSDKGTYKELSVKTFPL